MVVIGLDFFLFSQSTVRQTPIGTFNWHKFTKKCASLTLTAHWFFYLKNDKNWYQNNVDGVVICTFVCISIFLIFLNVDPKFGDDVRLCFSLFLCLHCVRVNVIKMCAWSMENKKSTQIVQSISIFNSKLQWSFNSFTRL